MKAAATPIRPVGSNVPSAPTMAALQPIVSALPPIFFINARPAADSGALAPAVPISSAMLAMEKAISAAMLMIVEIHPELSEEQASHVQSTREPGVSPYVEHFL